MPYIQNTDADRAAMLSAIGARDTDELFAPIPESIRLRRDLDLPRGRSEYEVLGDLGRQAARNRPAGGMTSFLGAGTWDGIVPSVVGAILSRSEFYTAYTPYQAEISQGTLQTIYEFQSMIAHLTGLDLANASMYDGATALAESAMLLTDHTSRRRIVAAGSIHPRYRTVLDTYVSDLDLEVATLPYGPDGRLDLARLGAVCDGTAAVLLVQQPNFFGLVEDTAALRRALDALPAERRPDLVACVDPVSLGVLVPPGEYGAVIAVGEGQALGLPQMYGGPLVGFVACDAAHVRKIPGRLVGATRDAEGRRGYVLTLQTREQHIRREKATSNICTNQALLALAATVYMAAVGESGFRERAHMCLVKAHRLAQAIAALPGWSMAHEAPFFREFVVRAPIPARAVVDAAKTAGVLAGLPLAERFALPGIDTHHLLVAVSEKRTEAEIDAFAALLARIGGRA